MRRPAARQRSVVGSLLLLAAAATTSSKISGSSSLRVAVLRDLQPATFRSRCIRQGQPCLLTALLSPATPADTERWSRAGMIARHADTTVVLGTNRSLAVRGAPSSRAPTRLADYLGGPGQQCDDSLPGYLFLSAGNEPSRGALLDEAEEAVDRWSRGVLAEFLGELGASEPVLAVSGGEGSGIPWHRHHAAWLVLLHGAKRWHLYPPSVHPPGIARRDAAAGPADTEAAADGGHAEWMGTVLPTLPEPERPMEVVQRAGELMYVPEGWWHATANDLDGELSVGIGAQARSAESRGTLQLAMDVVPLMEAGNFEAALLLTQEALSEGVSLREVGELHGDILMAISDRDGGAAGAGAYTAAAVAAYEAAVRSASSRGTDGGSSRAPAALFFKLGRAQSGAQVLRDAKSSYKQAMDADPSNALGVRAEALVALAVDALNSGQIEEGVRRAGAAAMKWGSARGAEILQDVARKAQASGDGEIASAVRKQLARRRRGG